MEKKNETLKNDFVDTVAENDVLRSIPTAPGRVRTGSVPDFGTSGSVRSGIHTIQCPVRVNRIFCHQLKSDIESITTYASKLLTYF